jgi:uncharacterized protein involved in type VI secretion and phage assembly
VAGSVVSAKLSVAASGSTTALPVQCVRALVQERIGRPYSITLDMLTDARGLDPATMMGQAFDVTYGWDDGMSGQSGLRRWSGVVVSLVFLGSVQDPTTPLHYRAFLQPPLALARRTIRTRSLVAPAGQFCTVRDVLAGMQQNLLAGARLDHVDAACPRPAFPFFTQYEESDLDFLNRLVETYGISYFWTADTRDDHGAGGASVLWFTDNNNGFQPVNPVPPGAKAADCLPVNPNAGPASSVRAVYRATMRFGLVPAEAEATAWNPPTEAGGTDGAAQVGTWPTTPGEAMQRFGLYPIPGSRAEYRNEPIVSPDATWTGKPAAGSDPASWPDRLARARMEQAAMSRAQLAATSNLEGLFAGCAIRFDAGTEALGVVPHFDVNGYVIESIGHTVMGPGSHLCFPSRVSTADRRTLYRNSFRAVPVLVTGPGGATGFTYRPPCRTPRRVAPTLQRARLHAADTNQTFPDLDTAGRYLVVPDWPLEHVSGTGDPPEGLRMHKLTGFALGSLAQGTGSNPQRLAAGLHMPMRPGQSVLIGFVDGNPDEPYIAGVLPDAYQPSPVSNAASFLPHQSVLRTASGLTVRITDKAPLVRPAARDGR